MTDAGGGALVQKGREALAAHEWQGAYESLAAADARGRLSAAELELLGSAAWWTGRFSEALDARERAYAAATRAGDVPGAVLAAIELARDNLRRTDAAVAAGWMNRADRLLEGAAEGPGHGWLAATRAYHASVTGNQAEALAQATRAADLGKRLGIRDLEVFGLSEKGAILLSMGRVDEGLALADEATAAAISGELDPEVAGGVACATIESCAGIGDLRRAGEWIEAQDRWCRREGITGYPGMCRLFRSEIKCLRGTWPEAEAEALVATDELLGFMPGAAGMAWFQIGEIRRRRGDLPGAEEALLTAHASGQDPEPILSQIRLAQGRTEEAAASIRRVLAEPAPQPNWRTSPNSPVWRLAVLPAAVDILLADGDVNGARAAADELDRLADSFKTTSARAKAASAGGAVTLAEGRAGPAVGRLHEAVSLWNDLDAPWDLALARMTLAAAYRAEGAADRAVLEVRAARAAFEALGARLDLARADAVLEELRSVADELPVGMAITRVERSFMFTDIVGSTRLAEELGDDTWNGIMRMHDRLIRSAAAEHGGVEVKSTGDGFFLAFADPRQAVSAAVEMQRRLHDEGGAGSGVDALPQVRIGLHQAEANRVGLDFVGSGVNVAARISDAAAGGEILVSESTLERGWRDVPVGEPRLLELKGVSAPVPVRPVRWDGAA
jgi:class 3 adenylate cyclase